MQIPTQNLPAVLPPEQINDLLLAQLKVARETLDVNWSKPRTDRWVQQYGRIEDGTVVYVAVEFGYSYRRFETRFLWAEGGDGNPADWRRPEPIVFNVDTYRPNPGGVNPFLFLVDRFVTSLVGESPRGSIGGSAQ